MLHDDPHVMTDSRQLIDEQIAYYRARARDTTIGGSGAGATIMATSIARHGLPKLPFSMLLRQGAATRTCSSLRAEPASGHSGWPAPPHRFTPSTFLRKRLPSMPREWETREFGTSGRSLEWQPSEQYDYVFFSFWLSHVPPDQFDAFWSKVEAALRPDGRAFFIDSTRNQASTASNLALSDVGNPITVRKLDDGRQFRIFKIFYDPVDLEHRLNAAG